METKKTTWGGRRSGAGRKPGSTISPELKKDQRIVVMCTKEQSDQLHAMAGLRGLSVGAFILETVLETKGATS